MMRRVLVAVMLLIGAATGGLLALDTEPRSLEVAGARCAGLADPSGCLNDLTDAALEVGAAYALSVLRAEIEGGSDALRSNCHPVAHRLGSTIGVNASDVEAEARAAGADAVLCDYGFVHGLLEGFAQRRGAEQMLPLGVPVCRAVSGNDDEVSLCLHGFGHSVLIANDGDLNAAFAGCDRLDGNDRLACSSGAAMQWAVSAPGTQARSLPGPDAYWPSVCETTGGLSRQGCLSQIWHSLRLYDMADERRGSVYALTYCRDTFTGEELATCVDGVGQQLWADGRPAPDAAEAICAQAGRDDLHLGCITGYANSRAVESFDAARIAEVCDVVKASLRERCLELAERDTRRRSMIDDPAWKN
jgi:hypothetical protein